MSYLKKKNSYILRFNMVRFIFYLKDTHREKAT